MTPEEVEQLLATMNDRSTVVTTNLLELEDLPVYKVLTDSKSPPNLTGTTKARVEPALEGMRKLWQFFGLFNDLLRSAQALRGSDRRLKESKARELEQLLTGPSIKLPATQIPLAQRGLLTAAETDDCMTPSDLLRAMSDAFEAAKRVVIEVDEAWDRLLPGVAAADEGLRVLLQLTAELALEPSAELTELQTKIRRYKALVVSDPLGTVAGFDREVSSAMEALRTQFLELKRQRDSIPDDLRRAEAIVTEIKDLIARGATALAVVREKIKNPEGLKEPLGTDILTVEPRGLIPWLERLRILAETPRWQTARKGLDQWLTTAGGTRTAAEIILSANETPCQMRNELRGLLEALKAKASATGLSEDPALCLIYEEARRLLFTAPCDLTAASAAVSQYGAGLR